MFIPQGKAEHENLSTRYLLVDELIKDLCEQSFAGIIETKLLNEEYYVMIDEGRVVAVVDSNFARINLNNVVARARAERGIVSIYAYPQGLAMKVAGRMVAEPLYVNLSAEFADLEKLIGKLMREPDRRWFIEVKTAKEKALIFIEDGKCTLITATGAMLRVAGHTTAELQNSELKELIEKCHSQGGSFDVLFQHTNEELVPEEIAPKEAEPKTESDSPNHEPEPTPTQQSEEAQAQTQIQEPGTALSVDTDADFIWKSDDANIAVALEPEAESLAPSKDAWQEPSRWSANFPSPLSETEEGIVSASSSSMAESASNNKADDEERTEVETLPTHDFMAALGSNREALAELKLAEVKRLMGKILKTIADAARVVEQRDNFNLHLRAGQLKVADRFAFLDPFGSEFEYFDGEIAFIGHCESDYFIQGLTEAVKIAITEAAQASAKPVQVRTFINEELQRLLEANRQEFELYHLDDSINEIIGRQLSKLSAAE